MKRTNQSSSKNESSQKRRKEDDDGCYNEDSTSNNASITTSSPLQPPVDSWGASEVPKDLFDKFMENTKEFGDDKFLLKLYDLLEEAAKDQSIKEIISWNDSGTEFKVHDRHKFDTDILPKYFPQMSFYHSFRTRLHVNKFKSGASGYYNHPKFQRGDRDACNEIKVDQMMHGPDKVDQEIIESIDTGGNKFMSKLYELLEEAAKDQSIKEIISWNNSGTEFKVHDRHKFEKVILPKYFPKMSFYTSFRERLYVNKFKSAVSGYYYHPKFQRGDRDASNEIKVDQMMHGPDKVDKEIMESIDIGYNKFMLKLYELLEEAEKEESIKEIISWNDSGTEFKVHDRPKFVTHILPKYFPKMSFYDSFRTRLYVNKFKSGAVSGYYYHPKFQRGDQDACNENIFQRTPSQNWACDYCNDASFTSYDEACRHEAICFYNPVVQQRHTHMTAVGNENMDQRTPSQNWACDYCNDASFTSYEEACRHEAICSYNPVVQQRHTHMTAVGSASLKSTAEMSTEAFSADSEDVYSQYSYIPTFHNFNGNASSYVPTFQNNFNGSQSAKDFGQEKCDEEQLGPDGSIRSESVVTPTICIESSFEEEEKARIEEEEKACIEEEEKACIEEEEKARIEAEEEKARIEAEEERARIEDEERAQTAVFEIEEEEGSYMEPENGNHFFTGNNVNVEESELEERSMKVVNNYHISVCTIM